MKNEFKARPVHLSREDRIIAYFATCFISLIMYHILEKRLGEKYTCKEILFKLREINFHELKGECYIPTYTRNNLTDDLHKAKKFLKKLKIKNITHFFQYIEALKLIVNTMGSGF